MTEEPKRVREKVGTQVSFFDFFRFRSATFFFLFSRQEKMRGGVTNVGRGSVPVLQRKKGEESVSDGEGERPRCGEDVQVLDLQRR